MPVERHKVVRFLTPILAILSACPCLGQKRAAYNTTMITSMRLEIVAFLLQGWYEWLLRCAAVFVGRIRDAWDTTVVE